MRKFVVFRTILLSIISLLNEPNTFSPANVDASVAFRKWRDSKGKEKDYANIIRLFLYTVCTLISHARGRAVEMGFKNLKSLYFVFKGFF